MGSVVTKSEYSEMRSVATGILNGLCRMLVLPSVLCCRLQAALLGRDRAFCGWSQLYSLLPGLTGQYLRQAFFRSTMRHCGDKVCVSFGTVFSHSGVSLGDFVYIGSFCSIGDVVIEDDVLIASHVSVMNGCRQHATDRLDLPIREQPGIYEPITIGCDSWIGEHATVAASIGRHCVIGAGSLVLQPVPDYAVAVGVHARVIRDRRDVRGEIRQRETGGDSAEF